MNKLSKLFQPINVIPKNAIIKNQEITSKSQRLMLELGLIKGTGHGCFHLLPLMQKSLEKLINIIDINMNKINAQKITMPHLTSIELWEKTGRLNTINTELLKTRDRQNKIQILCPTHEESITALLATMSPISYKQFPLRLYQIGTKFRDELKPRFGLMRAKEFIMKDCYTFDVSKENAKKTYHELNCIYQQIFDTIKVPYIKVTGDTGAIGGSTSHEYHYTTNVGEDTLIQCKKCNYSSNTEICGDTKTCPSCQSLDIIKTQGIEIGHTFLLEDKYSKPLNLYYSDSTPQRQQPLLMGCYGIGITRLIAAAIEVLSLENEIRWPFLLAPYKICIIPPKAGSKEENFVKQYTEQIYYQLNEINGFTNSIIIDDRNELTIGKRLLNSKRSGYPIIIVIGAKATNNVFELFNVIDDKTLELNLNEVITESVNILNKNA